MPKTLNYRLALLSFVASFGLLATAQAADFEIVPPEIGNFSCGADSRGYPYTVYNHTGKLITLEEIEFEIGPHDTFSDNPNMVTHGKGGTCVIGEKVGESCVFYVDFHPNGLNCYNVSTGTIDREVKLRFNSTSIDPTAPVVSHLTRFGAAEDFVLMAPSVLNQQSAPPPATVCGDVASTIQTGYVAEDIRDSLSYPSQAFTANTSIVQAAQADLKGAYRSYNNMQYDGCTQISSDLGGWPYNPGGLFNPLGPGVYCFHPDRSPVVMRGPFFLRGSGDPDETFTFIVDFAHTHNSEVVLWMIDNVNVVLLPSSPGGHAPSAESVTFAVRGAVEANTRGYFSGNILSTCGFEVDEDKGNMSINGRILAIGELCVNPSTDDDNSDIILNGNSAVIPIHGFCY